MGFVTDVVLCASLFIMGFLSYDLFMADMKFVKGLTHQMSESLSSKKPNAKAVSTATPMDKAKEEPAAALETIPQFDNSKTYFFKKDGVLRNLSKGELDDPIFVKTLLKTGKIIEG